MAGGVAHYDAAETAADIAAAREVADSVIVSLHWGEEHRRFPREKDRAIARSLIDAGADAILGHHPHILQGAEFYRGAPILYSLGNFIFDMVSPKTYESAAAMLRFERGARTTLRLLPLRIDAATFAPEAAVGEDGRRSGASSATAQPRWGVRVCDARTVSWKFSPEAYSPESLRPSSSIRRVSR
jgi:poly-gamma-glutamate synthesis protein (capsule biosynthesis protein)